MSADGETDRVDADGSTRTVERGTGMSEGQKRKTALQEIKELRQAIEPSKNDVIARRALELAEYYLIHAENQAGHIQRLEERNKRMRGRWETIEGWDGDEVYRCSVCGEEYVLIDGTPKDNGYHFCPHCGADMREEQDESN